MKQAAIQATLELRGITKSYGDEPWVTRVLSDVSVLFGQAESYALSGVSGSGKSTLLAILAGFEKPTAGTVLWNGHDLSTLTHEKKKDFLYRGIGMLFQRPYLMRELTVLENVMIKSFAFPADTATIAQRARELLAHVGLAHCEERYPQELSGGEQIRVALVRALVVPPQFLIADEPTAHLDSATAARITDLIFDESARSGSGLIIATHDPSVSDRCTKKYILHSGNLHL